ncbi:WHIM1 domain [Dillenia turbinata]|uniref:WHIM1 domain n=1 Tax=Dillenia turbinata TaxID=194707 RepID=A0AAN8V7Q4_9MAGN
MDLNDSAASSPILLEPKEESSRSILEIDLNEIPSSSSSPFFGETLIPSSPVSGAFAIVRSIHENLTPAPGGPAEVPAGESGCSGCGKSDVRGSVVVCDGCERGFHMSCAGMRGRQAVMLEDWVCAECVSNGARSQRWELGKKRKNVRLLDINALPPTSDNEAEGSDDLQEIRYRGMPISGENSFGGNLFGAPVTCTNFWFAGNGFGFQKALGRLTPSVELGFEDALHHRQYMAKSLDKVDWSPLVGKLRGSNDSAIRLPHWNSSEMFMHALREFISERNGVLEEGWHVEFQQSMSGCELYAVYCAPNGKKFDSMFDVASYLGLMSNCSFMEPEVRRGSYAALNKRLQLPKRRKLARFSQSNGVAENRETLASHSVKELVSDDQIMDTDGFEGTLNSKISEVEREKNFGTGIQQFNAGLPVQYEDFFVLSLGKIDSRPSYHDLRHIWPVGYSSCWHDIVTGSVFQCYVLDGGDAGPVFKVLRSSCSSVPIPVGSTVLCGPELGQSYGKNNGKSGVLTPSTDYNEDHSIQMILLDPCSPTANDISSCIGTFCQTSNGLQFEPSLVCQQNNSAVSDEIGNLVVEGSTSSSVWTMISEKLVDTCCDIYKRRGTLKFYCKHLQQRTFSTQRYNANGKSEESLTSLAKFCSLSGSFGIPFAVQDDKEFQSSSWLLAKWLDQDRFGLDVEFVQEIIERMPGIHSCSNYEFLNQRSNFSALLTVGSGHLRVEKKNGLYGWEEEAVDGLNSGCNSRLVGDLVLDDHHPPPGKPLGSRLPPELVGDVLQIWELLYRFHEVLDLKEPLSLDELEEELLCPWFDLPNVLQKLEGETWEHQETASCRTDGTSPHILSPDGESGSAVSGGGPHVFLQMETDAMKVEAQSRLASTTYSRCTGVALAKAHKVLLNVLVGELQLKVAALADPNFDVGESKPRRGRKKETDNAFPAKMTKLNMLPINEVTWPELARRYILAVLAMDGNLDSTETISRESGKVFRCLQGDGGVLCGSLTGVASMEADALLLAEATKHILGSLNHENNVLTLDDHNSDATGACEKTKEHDIPEWAQLLEPVRKLPTNVGTRIRKCVYDALEKSPPEWAKKRLEHSISKEVYKGNASGPTKVKAVLSVLADVYGERAPGKPLKEKKEKTVIYLTDIVARLCRKILRKTAAEDDEKVFCNLLARNLLNSSDNDEDGLLGPPAIMSRPLDFRTIDLRLALGAYGGSHEAFLEDVQELWNTLHVTYADRPDLLQLVETLSEKFETLYEQEVLACVRKFKEYANSESLTEDTRKEVSDFLVSANEMPKAPWDEGVCKVCGIDKDDDSVLLCDTCDAEYHMYCLNPPLARIPEGNWYCPSCLAGRGVNKDAQQRRQIIGQKRGIKYQGEASRIYLEAFTQLVSVMGEKEYWELSVAERIFLLKFLSDELLSSAVIRQHIEQCGETSSDLQQKLRALSMELKNLKLREEILAMKAAKIDSGLPNGIGEIGTDGASPAQSNLDKCTGQPHALGDRSTYSVFIDAISPGECGQMGSGPNGFSKDSSLQCSADQHTPNGQVKKSSSNEGQSNDAGGFMDDSLLCRNHVSHMVSQQNGNSCMPSWYPLTSALQVEGIDDIQLSKQQTNGKDTSSFVTSEEVQKLNHLVETESTTYVTENQSVAANELQAYTLELNSVKNDLSVIQDSIVNIESQFLKLSTRREFLGSDSSGQLYWVLAKPGMHSWLVVDQSVRFQQRKTILNHENPMGKGSVCGRSAESIFPSSNKTNNMVPMHSSWVSLNSDTEIHQVLDWLNDHDPKERELKESILQWQKLRVRVTDQGRVQDHYEHQTILSSFACGDETSSTNSLNCRASSLLERKYGPCFETETTEVLKKRGKKVKVTNDGKMYRCECLEPIWPSRHHCASCHRTFPTVSELEGHSDCKRTSGPLASQKSKEHHDALKGKGLMTVSTGREEGTGERESVEASDVCSELSLKMIKYQNEGLVCPYDIEKVSARFMTNNFNRELVQEIGLIGSNGVPVFVPCESHCLSDLTSMLVRQNDLGATNKIDYVEKQFVFPEEAVLASMVKHDVCSTSPSKSAANSKWEAFKPYGSMKHCFERKDKAFHANNHDQDVEFQNCCVVPQPSLRSLTGKSSQILKHLKICLLDMDAALPKEALRPSKSQLQKRWAWRSFVKAAQTIFQMVQATIVLEDMIKTEYLRNWWWYWSSLSAAAKTSTISSLALRIYSLDAAVVYEETLANTFANENTGFSNDPSAKAVPAPDPTEKSRIGRKPSKRRELEG